MTVSTKVGTFTILSSDAVNTTQQITVGFQPKLILFWSTGQASATDAVTSQTARYGFGAAASSTLRQCVGGTSTHASAAIDGGRIARVDACFATILAAGTVDGLLDISAIDSTSFTVIVDDQFASSIRISYMAFGGDAITDVVMGVFATNTTTGTQDITGLSFQPNFLMTFGSASTTAAPFASSSRDFISVGAASSASNQAIISIGEGPEANATSQASSYLYYGEVAAPLFDTPTEMRNRASFVQFLSTGFRLNWLEAAFAYQLMYVAVRGGSWSVGNLQTQTNTTTDIAKSGIGFQPAGVILFSHNMVQSTQDTVQGDGRLSIGAFTSTTERVAQALLLETGLADTDVTNAIEHDEVYANIATDGTIQGLMDVKSVDADGFTLIMDDADPAQAYAYYIAVGESSAVTISKSFAFASDAEGLADAGNHASLTFAYEAADGNPAGSVKFTTTLKAATQTEFARNASTGQTWESWGVPAGATVTNVAIGLWNEKTVGITKLSSHSLKARIISSGGTTVHSASDLLNATLAITSDSTWQTGAAGPSVAVDSGYQASTTDVRLELEYTCVTGTGGGNAAVDQRFDNIRIDITYTPAPSGTTYDNTVSVAVTGSVSGSGKLTISPTVSIATGVTTSDGGTLNGINRTTLAVTHSIASAGTLSAINRLTLAAIESVTASGKLLLPGTVSLPSTVALSAGSTLNATGTATISATVASSASTQASFGTSISMPITAATTAASLLNSLASVAVGMLGSVGNSAQLSASATTTLAATVTLNSGSSALFTLSLAINAISGIADSSQMQAVGNALMALVSAAQAASTIIGNNTVTMSASGDTATAATLTGQNRVTLQVTDGVQPSSVLTANNTLSIGYTVTVDATSADGAPITLTMQLPVSASLSALSIAQMVGAATMAAVTGITGTASAVFGASVPVAVAIAISENGTLTQTANVTVPVSGEVGTGATLEANSTVMIASAVASMVTSQLDGMSSVDIATVQGVVSSGTLSVLNSLSLQLTSGMLASGSTISFTVTTPDGRTVTVQFEARVLDVGSEVRVVNVDSENRTFVIGAVDQAMEIPAENRELNIRDGE